MSQSQAANWEAAENQEAGCPSLALDADESSC